MDGGTRWITEEERARIALKYGPPHKWKDPNPRPGVSTTFASYVPTAADVRELDREAQRRQDEERMAGGREQISRERAPTIAAASCRSSPTPSRAASRRRSSTAPVPIATQ